MAITRVGNHTTASGSRSALSGGKEFSRFARVTCLAESHPLPAAPDVRRDAARPDPVRYGPDAPLPASPALRGRLGDPNPLPTICDLGAQRALSLRGARLKHGRFFGRRRWCWLDGIHTYQRSRARMKSRIAGQARWPSLRSPLQSRNSPTAGLTGVPDLLAILDSPRLARELRVQRRLTDVIRIVRKSLSGDDKKDFQHLRLAKPASINVWTSDCGTHPRSLTTRRANVASAA